MKLAIMQPYLFPYLGYFQLLNHVDHFILFDDVNYMKRKWINRNKILVNNNIHVFTVPVIKSSQNRKINEVLLCEGNKWKPRLLKTIALAYKRAPEFDNMFPVFEAIIMNKEKNLSEFIQHSLNLICSFLGITTKISCSSSLINRHYNDKGESRIINICLSEKATEYFNPANGRDLYEKSHFLNYGIDLKFISSKNDLIYKQFNDNFIENLSIIDVLMFNTSLKINKRLSPTILE